jgi:CubicO group peptidase (beta-lactamase class C family)
VLLKPLSLVPHFVVGTGERRPFVSGHAVQPGLHRVRPVAQSLTSVKAPAGALAASALDLITLGRLLASGEPAGLIDPVALAEMRRPVPHGVPFGLADGWSLGLALFRDGATTWLGHDGNGDGTACHLRFDPAGGTVVALTTNGNSGFGMWLDLVQDLRVAGCPVGDYDRLRGLQGRRSSPPNCTGSYVNGDIEYTVQPARDGTLLLTVDGEPFAELTPHEGLIFAMRDVDTDENNQMGRFLPDPHGDGIGWIQIGGRLARRKSHA